MRRLAVSAVLCSVLASNATAQQPRDIALRGLEAIGGEHAARGVTALTQEFYVVTFNLGQTETPASPLRATVATGRIVSDWGANRRHLTQETRTLAGQVVTLRAMLVGGSGATINPAGQQVPLTAVGVAAQQRSLRSAPHRLLLAALEPGATLQSMAAREYRGLMHDGVRLTTADDTITLYFDRLTGLLTLAETEADDPVLGVRVTTTWFTRWQPTTGGGVMFPRQIDAFANGHLVSQLVTTRAAVEPAPDSLFALADSIARRAPAPAAPLAVRMVELAPGVWRAEGGTHFTLIVEQPDQLVLVEAPQSTERVRAVLDTVRARWPGKRIGAVVMTHYHFDHSGGIREAIAEGIPVVTHQVNAAFVRQVAAAQRRLAPDLLSRRRRAPVVRTLTDSLVIGGGDSRVVVYRQPTMHAEGLVSVWVPTAGLLFTADVLAGGGATLAPVGSGEMAALARARGLAPRTFAAVHGTVIPWADVERAAAGSR